MVTGIVIPHETSMAMQRVDFENLTDYQSAVGGYIETIHIDDHPLVIVANEEGKVHGLPVNKRATCLWWLLHPAGIGGDELVGDIVILGPIERGEITSAPDMVMELLLEAKRFQVEVRLSKGFDTWVPIGDPLNDFFGASLRAFRLMQVGDPPRDVKVIAVE